MLLYELLADQLPFTSDDPMEIIFSHISRKPIPPTEASTFSRALLMLSHRSQVKHWPEAKTAPHVVQALSDICMKLLSKNKEDRYQSAVGCQKDLELCAAALATKSVRAVLLAAQSPDLLSTDGSNCAVPA